MQLEDRAAVRQVEDLDVPADRAGRPEVAAGGDGQRVQRPGVGADVALLGAGGGVPEPDVALVVGGEQEPAVGGEGEGEDVAPVPAEQVDEPSRGRVPEADPAVLAARGGEQLAVRAEGQRVDAVVAAVGDVNEAAGAEAGDGAGGQGVAVAVGGGPRRGRPLARFQNRLMVRSSG